MTNRGATGRYRQGAFLQAEGELCLRGELQAQNRRRNAYAIRITKHWRRSSAPIPGSPREARRASGILKTIQSP
jgi:hypothetical protein